MAVQIIHAVTSICDKYYVYDGRHPSLVTVYSPEEFIKTDYFSSNFKDVLTIVTDRPPYTNLSLLQMVFEQTNETRTDEDFIEKFLAAWRTGHRLLHSYVRGLRVTIEGDHTYLLRSNTSTHIVTAEEYAATVVPKRRINFKTVGETPVTIMEMRADIGAVSYTVKDEVTFHYWWNRAIEDNVKPTIDPVECKALVLVSGFSIDTDLVIIHTPEGLRRVFFGDFVNNILAKPHYSSYCIRKIHLAILGEQDHDCFNYLIGVPAAQLKQDTAYAAFRSLWSKVTQEEK